jgi:hypothetical protein
MRIGVLCGDGRHNSYATITIYNCELRLNGFTGTALARKHHSIATWIFVLYLMGLNVSNNQIAAELDLDPDVAQTMTMTLR